MKFDVFFSSVTGYKNKIKGKSSQDYLKIKKVDNGIICAIGDGHGIERCKYSYKGSEFACDACLEILENLYNEIKFVRYEDLEYTINYMKKEEKIQKLIQERWREYVLSHYKTKIPNVYNVDYVLYGTTLIGSLITDNVKVYIQIGDGNIIEYKNKFNLIKYNKNSKVYGVLNSMYLDDAYKYIDLNVSINDINTIDSIVIFSDGFINSFRTYEELNNSLRATIKEYRKNVFSKYNLEKEYKKYLEYLTINKSKDDISIIFIM